MIRSDAFTPTQQRQKKKQQEQLPPAHSPPAVEPVEPADTDIISEVIQGPREPPSSYTGEPLSSPAKQQQPQQQQPHQKTRPEKLSPDNFSFEERKPVDPAASSGEDAADENQPQLVVASPQGSAFSKEGTRSTFSKQSAKTLDEEFKELDESLDLHMSTSTSTATAASKNHISAKSPKYGRAPTPERMTPPRSALGEENGDRRFKDEDKSSGPRDPGAANNSRDVSMDNGATSDFVPPSTTGTNSTIMHMNLSTEVFVKRELERRQGREEKKEEDVGPVGGVDEHNSKPTMASDEDWLDELVSRIGHCSQGVIYLSVSSSNRYCSSLFIVLGKTHALACDDCTTGESRKEKQEQEQRSCRKGTYATNSIDCNGPGSDYECRRAAPLGNFEQSQKA
jgi:hypothetical protein